jgi:putative oxidoreductase
MYETEHRTLLGRGTIPPCAGMNPPGWRVVGGQSVPGGGIVRGRILDQSITTPYSRYRAVNLFAPAREGWTGLFLSILRVVAALVFMQHGSQKLFHYPPSGAPGPVMPLVLMSQTGLAGILEFFGGLCILLGFLTRPVAFVLAGEMAVAYFQVHAPRAFLPIVNRGELAVVLCFVFLYFAFAGAGPWSVDALILGARVQRTGDRAEGTGDRGLHTERL